MAARKKILFVLNDATVTGGSSLSSLNLAEELRSRHCCEIFFILPNNGPMVSELERRKFTYKIIKYYSWIYNAKEGCNAFKKKLKLTLTEKNASKIAHWAVANGIEIVHSANSAVYVGALVAREIEVPHVWHIREFLREDHGLEFIDEELARDLLSSADKIICVSKAIYNKYCRVLPKSKMVVIYNGVAVPDKRWVHINRKKGKDDEYRMLIAGSINEAKGQKEAIDALRVLTFRIKRNVKLAIAGTGPDEKILKDYVMRAGLAEKVEFLGFVSNLSEVRHESDIALTCSKNEAFGRVTAEAMMHGNLVVGADTGGTTELIKDGKTGILYRQGDFEDLAIKLGWCINNWGRCGIISENGRQYALENFSITRCAGEVCRIYDELLG